MIRRLLLRFRHKPGRGFRHRGRSSVSLKTVVALAAAVSLGLTLIGLAVVSWRQSEEDLDEFIDSFQQMYEQGEPPELAAAGESHVGTPLKQYDPKAMVFVDPKLRRVYGHEAEKGRHKRRLFTEVHDMTKAKGRPQLTLHQLMAMPSSFDPSAGVSDTTIILNQWSRTTLAEQLDAILRQTVRPAGGVWVCAFDSPRENEYRTVVNKYRAKFQGEGGGLFFVASSFNFKYYGRFQMALQARTKYVWVVDDDVMPGRHFLYQLSHVAGISEVASDAEGEGAGEPVGPMALGSVGWIMPGVKSSERFYSYRYSTDKGGLFLPDKRYGIPVPVLQEVDLLCSHWFVQTDWVKLLFREKWETPETGEDYMLAYTLRKHAGVRSYVMPMDLYDSETWGNMDVDWNMQHQGGGATTLQKTVPMRDRIWHRLLKRGGDYFMSLRYAARPRPIVLVIDGAFDARALRALFLQLQASYPPTFGGEPKDLEASSTSSLLHPRPPRVVLTGRGGSATSCSQAASSLGNPSNPMEKRGPILCNPDSFASAWNLVAARHFPRLGTGRGGSGGGRDPVLMVDLAAGLAGAVSTLKPLAVVSIAGTGPAAGAVDGVGGGGAALDEALAVVVGQAGVPLVRLPRRPEASAAALWLARLTPKAFRAWHRPRVDIVVVYEPSAGLGHTEAQLGALLGGLSGAHYLGDSVGVTVVVGSGPVPSVVGDDEFYWPRGRKVVRGGSLSPLSPSVRNGSGSKGRDGGPSASLTALALRSWVPRDDDSFVVVLEADQLVSPLFYSWLKVAVLETGYGDAAPKLSTSASRPPPGARGSVCVPGAEASVGVGGDAWLLPAGKWRAAQARCLGNDPPVPAAWERVGPSLACGGIGFGVPPPGQSLSLSLCPPLEGPGEALVGRTDADGALLGTEGGEGGGGGGLMEDGGALAKFVGRVLFS